MSRKPLIELRNVSISFPGVKALDGVDFQLYPGECHALVGENGAGKSTLSKIIYGVYPHYQGDFFFQGKKVNPLPRRTTHQDEVNPLPRRTTPQDEVISLPRRTTPQDGVIPLLRRSARQDGVIPLLRRGARQGGVVIRDPLHAQKMGISIVHQELQLIPEMTVLENIFLGKFTRRSGGLIHWKALEKKGSELLEFLHSDIDLKKPVKKLRTAEKQIVQLARALSMNASVVIFDELTAVLQEKEIENVFHIIRTLKQQGLGIIYISHRLNEIFQICDSYTVLCDGRLVKSGRTSEVTRDTVIQMMIGRDLKKTFPELNPAVGEVRVETRDITSPAFSGVNLEARAGEVVGIAGLMGAGKTEVLHALFGNLRCRRGEIRLAGKRRELRSPLEAIRNRIGLVPDERRELGLVVGFSVRKNITLASMKAFQWGRFFMKRKKEEEESERYIRLLDIACYSPEQMVEKMSGGNQQKVVFAKWLLADSDILLLDEPTRGIDVGAKTEIYQIINQLSREGKTIFLVSPELEELIGLCHRIYVMFEGTVQSVITGTEKTQEKLIGYLLGEEQEKHP